VATNAPVKAEPKPTVPMKAFERSFGFPLFRRLSREFDEMFGRFGFDAPAFENVQTWMPEVEMLTKDKALLVKMDVPGLKKEDITIEVNDDHLVISGERKHEEEEKKEGFFRTERTYGSFYRAVPLPEGVKPELAKATMKDGVLQVTMPIAKVEEKARKLVIGEEAPAAKGANATKAA
jgi:HSP20 family protein